MDDADIMAKLNCRYFTTLEDGTSMFITDQGSVGFSREGGISIGKPKEWFSLGQHEWNGTEH